MKNQGCQLYLLAVVAALSIASTMQAAVGDIDPAFNVGTGVSAGFDNDVFAVAVQPDGKIVVGGKFTSYKGTTQSRIVRLNRDGSVDSTFVTGTGIPGTSSTAVSALAIQSDGKILLGGNFTSYNGTTRRGVARLNSDGTVDAGFQSTGAVLGSVSFLYPLLDGRTLVGGTFNNLAGSQRYAIGRLKTDGKADALFGYDFENGSDDNTIFMTGATVNSILVDAQNRIIAAGGMVTVTGSRTNIAALTIDGMLDTTFELPLGTDDTIRTMVRQPDGKLIIGGDFTQVGGQARSHVARLLPDGAVDTSFNLDANPNSGVYSIALDESGKILIAGDFNRMGEVTFGNIARLNSDGTLDVSFAPAGASSLIFGVAAQPDGDVVIGGNFQTFNGSESRRIVRLDGDQRDLVLNTLSGPAGGKFVFSIIGEVGRNYSVDYSTDLVTWTPIAFTSTNFTTLITNDFGSAPRRFYRATMTP